MHDLPDRILAGVAGVALVALLVYLLLVGFGVLPPA